MMTKMGMDIGASVFEQLGVMSGAFIIVLYALVFCLCVYGLAYI